MRRATLGALTVIFALLGIISIIGLYFAHQQPAEEKKLTTLCAYTQDGRYDYIAALKPNSLYNQTTLRPGEGTLYIRITESINVTFTYAFNCSIPGNITLQHKIREVLTSSKWPEKTLAITPLTTLTYNQTNAVTFTANHFINVTALEELKNSIEKETGIYTSEYSLIIQPNIQITGNTTAGTINETFNPNMTMSFRYRTPEGDYIAVEGLTHTKQGGIQQTETLYHPEVVSQRYMSYAFSTAFISALLITAWMYVKTEPKEPAKPEKPIEEIIAPYEETIFEVAEEPPETLCKSTNIVFFGYVNR